MQRRTMVFFFLATALSFLFFFGLYAREMHRVELTRRAESIASELTYILHANTDESIEHEIAETDEALVTPEETEAVTGRQGQGAGQGQGSGRGLGQGQGAERGQGPMSGMGQGSMSGMGQGPQGGSRGMGQMGNGAGMGGYLRFLDDIAQAETWIVDKNADAIVTGQSATTISELPEEAVEMIGRIYDGQTVTSTSFRGMLEGVSTTVGVPVKDPSGSVMAALLLHGNRAVEMMEILPPLGILLAALVISLLISTILGRKLARSIEMPMTQMSVAAQRLTDGDYTARCRYRSNDEIGKLAENLDELAGRLLVSKEENEKQEEQRREFLASISHELRTPITVIRGSLETLSDGIIVEPKKVSEYSTQMLKEIIQLERLVNDLMDLTRMQNSSFTLQFEVVRLSDILSDAVRGMRQVARDKGLELVTTGDAAVNVWGDYTRLKQMLSVVLDNAIKFSKPGATISIRARADETDRALHVEISDQGVGIPQDQLPHIFDRFYTKKRGAELAGTGLGLAIAKSIAERHEIGIEVKSEIGIGTTFHFRIPITEIQPQ